MKRNTKNVFLINLMVIKFKNIFNELVSAEKLPNVKYNYVQVVRSRETFN